MAVAAGFESYEYFFLRCKPYGCGLEFLEAFYVLFELGGSDYISPVIKDSYIEGVKGYIYADKDLVDDLTSIFKEKSLPSIPSSGLIGVLRPNQLIGNTEGGGHTPLQAKSPNKMLSPSQGQKVFSEQIFWSPLRIVLNLIKHRRFQLCSSRSLRERST